MGALQGSRGYVQARSNFTRVYNVWNPCLTTLRSELHPGRARHTAKSQLASSALAKRVSSNADCTPRPRYAANVLAPNNPATPSRIISVAARYLAVELCQIASTLGAHANAFITSRSSAVTGWFSANPSETVSVHKSTCPPPIF